MKFVSVFFRWLLPVVMMAQIVSGCATPQGAKTPSPEEILRRDQAVVSKIAQQIESKLAFKHSPAVSIYLRKLAASLLEATPDLRGSPVGIWLIDSKKGKWNSYALPGNRIYLSIGLLRTITFENELAAGLALQFSHLVEKHALRRFLDMQHSETDSLFTSFGSGVPWSSSASVDLFGLNGVFAFSEDAEIVASKRAVGILYRAGFDARGLICLFEKFKNNSEHSPYELSTINKIIEQARREIASQAPLRNPIIRSQAFIKIQKRIQHL